MTIAVDMGRKATKTNKQTNMFWLRNKKVNMFNLENFKLGHFHLISDQIKHCPIFPMAFTSFSKTFSEKGG